MSELWKEKPEIQFQFFGCGYNQPFCPTWGLYTSMNHWCALWPESQKITEFFDVFPQPIIWISNIIWWLHMKRHTGDFSKFMNSQISIKKSNYPENSNKIRETNTFSLILRYSLTLYHSDLLLFSMKFTGVIWGDFLKIGASTYSDELNWLLNPQIKIYH